MIKGLLIYGNYGKTYLAETITAGYITSYLDGFSALKKDFQPIRSDSQYLIIDVPDRDISKVNLVELFDLISKGLTLNIKGRESIVIHPRVIITGRFKRGAVLDMYASEMIRDHFDFITLGKVVDFPANGPRHSHL